MKKRLDQLLVERGLVASREQARRFVLAGQVRVDGHRQDKPGRTYAESVALALTGGPPLYVSRGGLKLVAAFERFGIVPPEGWHGLDIGASTGGFTDCMLQRGAAGVAAVDTGRGQIHERLRVDPRVRLLESTNARYLTPEMLDGAQFNLAAIDVSFISLKLVLPPVRVVLAPGGCAVVLIKPQFEAGRRQVGSGGVVRDPAVHRAVLEDLMQFFARDRWRVEGLMASPVKGADGNVEFLALLIPESGPVATEPSGASDLSIRLGAMIDAALAQAAELGKD
jgi:23S rRNA (cytidine1920-2'-O)/16S rRNA (cytidine1409-2'-O)-methyltransferase